MHEENVHYETTAVEITATITYTGMMKLWEIPLKTESANTSQSKYYYKISPSQIGKHIKQTTINNIAKYTIWINNTNERIRRILNGQQKICRYRH